MILNSKDRSSFSLSLVDVPSIPHPTPGTNKCDSWLNINVSVRCPQGSWQVTDECLLLHEAEELAVFYTEQIEKHLQGLNDQKSDVNIITCSSAKRSEN